MMNNFNIQAYKDGNDVILVFKNASTDLESLIKTIVTATMEKELTINTVPALDEPSEVKYQKPENLEKKNPLIPDFLKDDKDDGDLFPEKKTVNEISKEDPKVMPKETINDKIMYGKYKGSTPKDVIKYNKRMGFIELLNMLYGNECNESASVKKEILVEVANYYRIYEKLTETGCKCINKMEVQKIINTYYPVCKSIVDKRMSEKSCYRLSDYYNVENETSVRNLCIECVREINRLFGV